MDFMGATPIVVTGHIHPGYSTRFQDFRFPSFPRRREPSKPLKRLDTRFCGYDEFVDLAEVLGLKVEDPFRQPVVDVLCIGMDAHCRGDELSRGDELIVQRADIEPKP